MNQRKYISLSPLFLDVRGRILCRKNCVALDEYCLSFFEQSKNHGRIWKIEMTSTVPCPKIPKCKGRLASRGLNWHWTHLQPNNFKMHNSLKFSLSSKIFLYIKPKFYSPPTHLPTHHLSFIHSLSYNHFQIQTTYSSTYHPYSYLFTYPPFIHPFTHLTPSPYPYTYSPAVQLHTHYLTINPHSSIPPSIPIHLVIHSSVHPGLTYLSILPTT